MKAKLNQKRTDQVAKGAILDFFPYLPTAAVIIFDQVSKFLVVNSSGRFSCNFEGAFNLLPEKLTYILAPLALVVVFILWKKEKNNANKIAFSMIIGGGLSNLIDRVTRGCVVDFIDLKIWPSFNLADAAITIGISMLIVQTIKSLKIVNKN